MALPVVSSIPIQAKIRSESLSPGPRRPPAARPIEEALRRAVRESDREWPETAFESAAEAIADVGVRFGFSPALVLSLIQHESAFRLDAVSRRGAVGLMQILPATALQTAKESGLEVPGIRELFDPGLNIRLGLSYLAILQRELGSLDAALTAYRGGPVIARAGAADPAAGAYLQSIRQGEQAMAEWMKSP